MEDGSERHCAALSMSISSPTDKQTICLAEENESNNSSTHSTSTSNMANYPDNELSEADIDTNRQSVQPEVKCQEVTTVNGDLDLSMSPTIDRSVTVVKVNGKTVPNCKEDEDFDNTSDNDALVIDEERLSVIEDKTKQKMIPDETTQKSPLPKNDHIPKHIEDVDLIPEHSNPYFSESIFELLNKKAAAALPKKKAGVNKSKSATDRQSNNNTNKHLSKDYAQYLGLQPSVQQMLKCARCNLAGFPTVTMLNDHLVKCGSVGHGTRGSSGGGAGSGGGVDTINNINRLNKKIFLCSTCATYHTQAELFLHILHTHRRYVCLYCQGMFPGAERLARHLGNRHGACRFQKNRQEEQQQENEPSYVNNNNNNVLLNNGGMLNVSGQGESNNSRLDRRYGNMQDFRKFYKEECYLVCCGCERVFGGGPGGRGGIEAGEFDDRELEGHVCERGNLSPILPSQLPRPITPRTIASPLIMKDNNYQQMSTFNHNSETSPRDIVAQSNDNTQSLKLLNTDSSNHIPNAQTKSIAHSPAKNAPVRDTMQNVCRIDENEGRAKDVTMMMVENREDGSEDGIEDDHEQPVTSPPNTPPNLTPDPNQPDTRKVPKVTLKLTKPYQPHSDYSDSDSYLSEENNDGRESSDSDKLMMQVDVEEGEHAEEIGNNHYELNKQTGDGMKGMDVAAADDEEQADGLQVNDVVEQQQMEDKVAQIDGGADDESTADDGAAKLSVGSVQEQLQQQLPELAVAGSDVPVFELEEMLEQPLDKMEPKSLLRHMLLTSLPHCLYCNHARVIPVEGGQLALHALSEHRYSATVRSITAEELIPESFNSRLRECMQDLRGRFFNLQNQPEKAEGNCGGPVVMNKVLQFECFQCRYQTTVHKELYQHNRKLHSKALLLCIMCKTSFLHYSELICHLCPGIYDAAPLLEPAEVPHQMSAPNVPAAQLHGGGTDEDTNQSGKAAGGRRGGGSIAVPDIRFRCCLCTKDQTEPEEVKQDNPSKKENSVWALPSAFRLMVHLRKKHNLCDVCMEPCHSQQKLANHVWKHKLNHFCYRCGIAYRNKADITKHLYWKHGTESVDCRRCLLKRWPHVYHFCQPAAQFPCDECTLTFSRAMCLRVHKRLHLPTIEQQKPYVCTWGEEQEADSVKPEERATGKPDETADDQSRCETRTIEEEEERKRLKCEPKIEVVSVCGYRFVSRKMLRKHEFRHREPKDDESEQVIVDEVDISKEDIKLCEQPADNEAEGNKDNQLEQKADVPASSKEEIEAEEMKVIKPKVDVYDLPALNLSESDSSETEDETEIKMGAEPMKTKQEHANVETNDVDITADKYKLLAKTRDKNVQNENDTVKNSPMLENIWENFRNYQKSKLDRQSTNPSPSTSGFPMDDEEETPILTDIAPPLTEELVLQDHDYCLVTADKLIEKGPGLDDDNTQISSVDHDYCGGAKEGAEKMDEIEQKKARDAAVQQEGVLLQDKGTTNSGSDSDTSSCTCGSNCSCSSSSSSDGEDSTTSNDSSSDSSSSEGRRRQQAKREKKRQKKLTNKGRKNSTNITTEETTPNNNINTSNTVVDVVKREPVIHESDLETTESETDEDFYEEQPQRFALKLLAEKREKLLQKVDEDLHMNGSLLGSRPVTPSSFTAATQNPSNHLSSSSHLSPATHSNRKSKKSKSKNKKKKKKTSRRKRKRSKSHFKSSDINPSHLYAQQFQQHLQYQQLVQQQQRERQYGRHLLQQPQQLQQKQLQQQSVGVVAPITLSLKQSATNSIIYGTTPTAAVAGMTPGQALAALGAANTMAAMGGGVGGGGSLHGQSGNSTPDDGNTRASKRRRVPNKFYGYSSDEEGNMVGPNAGGSIGPSHAPKWRKIESPKRPRSPLVVPPITIKTIPPQVTIQSQQPAIPPLRIHNKSSHSRPPRQFHPPNSKYSQKTSQTSRKRSSAASTPNPPLPSFHQQQQHQQRHQNYNDHQQQQQQPVNNNNDSSDDNSSSDDEQQQQKQQQPRTPIMQVAPPPATLAPAPPPLPPQSTLQHRKGFSLQQQHQQQQRMLNSAVSIGAGVRRGPTGAIVGAGVAGPGTVPAAPGVALYCYCRCPYDEVSEMIGCDSDECAIEWFHFECVGIMVPPKGQWFCPDCRKRKQQRRELQLQQQKQNIQH